MSLRGWIVLGIVKLVIGVPTRRWWWPFVRRCWLIVRKKALSWVAAGKPIVHIVEKTDALDHQIRVKEHNIKARPLTREELEERRVKTEEKNTTLRSEQLANERKRMLQFPQKKVSPAVVAQDTPLRIHLAEDLKKVPQPSAESERIH